MSIREKFYFTNSIENAEVIGHLFIIKLAHIKLKGLHIVLNRTWFYKFGESKSFSSNYSSAHYCF